jgi:3,4-dihydroxy 2-butanone 4-phosphate synthase/GTP cyclohydrolase II
MAGLNPSGVICEIMNDDGTMARRDDLIAFAQRHGLKIATIADLIEHRRRKEKIVERRAESILNSHHGGDFKLLVYSNKIAYAEHIALVKGDLTKPGPVLVRMHALNVLDDVLGDQNDGRAGQLQASMRMIAEEGRGVIVLIREPIATLVSDVVRARVGGQTGAGVLRDYGVGAQILVDLGIRDMVLLSNTKGRTIVGLEGYGLRVVGQRPIESE